MTNDYNNHNNNHSLVDIEKFNAVQLGLELRVRDLKNDSELDPSIEKYFKPQDDKEYALKMLDNNKKVISFLTDPQNQGYNIYWASDLEMDQMVFMMNHLYLQLRENHPERKVDFNGDIIACVNGEPPKKLNIKDLYSSEKMFDGFGLMYSDELEILNEFGYMRFKRTKLANGNEGTKIGFTSYVDMSEYLPSIINKTRVERKIKDLEKVKEHNKLVKEMLTNFMKQYRKIDDLSPKKVGENFYLSDEYDWENCFFNGFSLN